MKSEVVQLCCDLIGVASVNPQSMVEYDDSVYGESRVAEYLAGWFRARGVEAEVEELSTGRANMLVRLKGSDSSGRYLFCGHLDTVDVDGMENPFNAELREGRIYGRGACDDKGPLASICVAAAELAKSGELKCDIDILASSGEEYDMRGAAAYASKYGDSLAGAVFAEPTEFDIIYAHKGVSRLAVIVPGVSVHSSMPEKGDNALYNAAEVLLAIRDFAEQKKGQEPHELLGTEAVVPTIINGGQQINIVPDRCEINVDWRTLPGRSPADSAAELGKYLRKVVRDDIEIEVMPSGAVAIESDKGSDMIQRLSKAANEVAGRGETVVAGFATDGSAFAHLDVPLAVIGPGSAAQAHRVDEYIEIEQLEVGVEVFRRFMLSLGMGEEVKSKK